MASGDLCAGTLPIISLLEDAIAYAQRTFDMTAKTIRELQKVDQLRNERGEQSDWRRLSGREARLTSFLHKLHEIQEGLIDIRRADFAALSLVWASSTEIIGPALPNLINPVADIESQVLDVREYFDGEDRLGLRNTKSAIAEELLTRYTSIDTRGNIRAIQHCRDIHPCLGALQLIKGEDNGGIDRCLRKDLNFAEQERLRIGGNHGAYLFWRCASCNFRIKYFISQSRKASLLTNDGFFAFKDLTIQSSTAFLAMSHLENRGLDRSSRFQSRPRYTCLICALHRPAAGNARTHTFPNKDEYAKHIEFAHPDRNALPLFFLQKMKIDLGDGLQRGSRKELWKSPRAPHPR